MEEKENLIEKFIQDSEKTQIPSRLSGIAARSEVFIYPNTLFPIFIGREKSLKALEASIENYGNYVFLVSQKEFEVEDPSVSDLYTIGTICKIIQIGKTPNGEYKVLVEGVKRAKIKKIISTEEYFIFDTTILEDRYRKSKNLEALVRKVKSMFERFMQLTKKFPDEAVDEFRDAKEPDVVADIIAYILPVGYDEKQQLLEAYKTKERLELELEILTREIELLEIEEVLETKVRNKFEKNQKNFYLQEKLRAIQEELKQGDKNDEVRILREKLLNGDYPNAVVEKVESELNKLDKMMSYSPEATVLRNYIDLLLDLPWTISTKDEIDIIKAKEILEKHHYGLTEPKERILEFLAIKELSSETKSPIICFVGAPGVGKTSLGRSIAESMGRKFGRISLGGMRDEAEIRGHRRTYVGALPGRIIQTVKKLGVNNPVIVLDEIDKLGVSYQGDPAAALLEVLDPEQNKEFVDNYIELPFDLSKVIFVTTANVLHTVPAPLRDRMEIIELPGYTDVEKFYIAKEHVIPKLRTENALPDSKFKFNDSAIKSLIANYTRESGVRQLEKQLNKAMRKAALKITEQKLKKLEIKDSNLADYLGPQPFFDTIQFEKPEVGIVNGLAYTAYGGSVMNMEAIAFPGKGELIATGQLGDVMKESSRIAKSLARKMLESKGKKYSTFFEKNDIHIHVPEGAVPKDGPSAGVTLTTVLISSITNIPVRNDIAMTGEITLRGLVLPVGGIKEKVLSAYRTGITEIILPFANERDIEKIPEDVRKKIKFHFVKNIEEVLELALVGGFKNAD